MPSKMQSEAPQKRILLVEDDLEFLDTLESYLISVGFEVETAGNGLKARKMLEENEYDLVVSDWRVPELGGIDLLYFVQQHLGLPFVLMTGFSDFLKDDDIKEVGATAFLSKPFSPEDLLITIENSLNVRRTNKGNPEDYSELPLDSLKEGIDVQSDVYIRLSTDHFVKVANPKSPLSLERLNHYVNRGIKALFVKK
jgi:DNA-binding NtrC family response regulator